MLTDGKGEDSTSSRLYRSLRNQAWFNSSWVSDLAMYRRIFSLSEARILVSDRIKTEDKLQSRFPEADRRLAVVTVVGEAAKGETSSPTGVVSDTGSHIPRIRRHGSPTVAPSITGTTTRSTLGNQELGGTVTDASFSVRVGEVLHNRNHQELRGVVILAETSTVLRIRNGSRVLT